MKLLLPSHQPFHQLVHLLAQHFSSYRKFMRANDNHTDGIFWVISRKTAHERKFIKTSFIVVVLKDIVSTCLFYTTLFERQSQLYGIVHLCCVSDSGVTDSGATNICTTNSPDILFEWYIYHVTTPFTLIIQLFFQCRPCQHF